ncbi:MAG: hypothetical protein ACRD6W_07615 [Nitrososphaerales archaeon]
MLAEDFFVDAHLGEGKRLVGDDWAGKRRVADRAAPAGAAAFVRTQPEPKRSPAAVHTASKFLGSVRSFGNPEHRRHRVGSDVADMVRRASSDPALLCARGVRRAYSHYDCQHGDHHARSLAHMSLHSSHAYQDYWVSGDAGDQ